MKTIRFVLVLFVGILFVLAYAQQKDELIFSHKFHAEDAGAACSDCHEAANTSQSATDNLLPSMQTCYNCHDESETECTYCHTNPDEAVESKRITQLKAKFSHQQHIEAGNECSDCHSGIEKEGQAGSVDFIPSRDDCSVCHGAADFSEEFHLCQQCHTSDFNFIPVNHTLTWDKNHGIVAQVEKSSCAHCHQNNYCIQCHEGDNLDRLAHPLNFINNHGIAARGNKQDCQTCHQEQSFCIGCHQANLVMPRSHSFANWSNTTNGGRHAREAQYDFDSCQSCHNGMSADLVCVRCHQK